MTGEEPMTRETLCKSLVSAMQVLGRGDLTMDELRDLVAVLPFASERHALEVEVYHALENHSPDEFTFDQLRRFRDVLATAEKRLRRSESRKVVSLSRYLDPDGERGPEP